MRLPGCRSCFRVQCEPTDRIFLSHVQRIDDYPAARTLLLPQPGWQEAEYQQRRVSAGECSRFSLKYSVSSSPPPWFQKLRDRQEQMELPSKSDDIIMLERQGRSSQKSRPSSGNLMQVTKLAVGQTDIRNIGQNVSTAATGSSLRGSSLPPPRNLKPPRKNFGFSGSLNRKDEVVGGRPVDGHNSPRRDQQPTFLQQLTGATYQRLSPTKKRSLLPTPARGNRPMAAHQYMPIGRSPSPAPHAHFILGRTPTPTPQQQQQQQKCTGSRNF